MFYIILAAILWGATNPFLKRFTDGFGKEEEEEAIRATKKSITNKQKVPKFLQDIKFLLSRPKYVITQIINLSGTAVFMLALSTTDISIAAVVTNALALVITCVVSSLLGDSVLTKKGMMGIVFVIAGLALCTYDVESRKQLLLKEQAAATTATPGVNKTV